MATVKMLTKHLMMSPWLRPSFIYSLNISKCVIWQTHKPGSITSPSLSVLHNCRLIKCLVEVSRDIGVILEFLYLCTLLHKLIFELQLWCKLLIFSVKPICNLSLEMLVMVLTPSTLQSLCLLGGGSIYSWLVLSAFNLNTQYQGSFLNKQPQSLERFTFGKCL